MKILLINPPFNRLKGIREFYFPIGLGYLAAVLSKEGHEVRIYNMDAPTKEENTLKFKDKYSMQMKSHNLYLENIKNDDHIVWKELKDVLNTHQPEIVGMTAMSCKFQSAVKVSKIFKNFNPKGIVLLGGAHATICSEEAVKNKFIDFIIRSEGERTVSELCKELENKTSDLSEIAGISYVKEGKVTHNKDRALIEDINGLPFPARHLELFPERYPIAAFGALVTMRGCPFRCAFCAAKCMWTRKVRKRDVPEIIDEIRWIIDNFKTKTLFFWDDSFTMDKERTLRLCKEIIDNKFNISWGCSTKVTILDEELVKIMKKAGCGSIELGVETGSEKMLKIIKKDITIPLVRKATKLLDKYNISYTQMLMVGFPEETEEDIQQTIKFIKETKKGFFCLSVFTPYPGTELYDTARNLGLIPETIDWEHFSHQSPENAFTKYIPKETLGVYVKQMNQLVDKQNSSFWRKWEYARARSGFYLKNPSLFTKRIREEMSRK